MRTAEREGRERAAYELAAAYCGGNPANPSSLSPARTAVSRRAECGASQRPMSARSTTSRPMALGRGAIGRRATSARSRHGWAGEIDGKFGLGLDFRKRRDDTARRRRMMLTDRGRGRAVDTTGNATAVNDLEALRDENHQLKVALSRVIEENKRYRVNKTRLEGELLRADGKVEVLLAELEQAPGNRDQRVISAARREVETCAVVRTLANQKGHLQHLLALQERELETIKRTKEWSAIMEMTAATEEYFVEIQRLQRLLAQQQQQQNNAAENPVVECGLGDSDEEWGVAREEYTPIRRDHVRRKNSGVDETIWTRRPEPPDEPMSIPSPNYGGQDAQRALDVETIATSSAREAYRNCHDRSKPSTAVQADGFFTAVEDRGGIDLPPREWGISVGREVHRRPASPKRRVSPPRRAQMSTRAGQKAFDNNNHLRSPADPRSSRRAAQQVPRVGFGRHQGGGSRSQASMRAASVRARACDANARTVAVGLHGRRPVSAPRRKMGTDTRHVVNARRTESLSSFGKGRQQEPPSGHSASGRGSGGGGACAGEQRTTRISSSPSRTRGRSIPAVAAPKGPSSSRKKRGGKGGNDGDADGNDGGNDVSLSGMAVARSPQQSVGDDFKVPTGRVDDGRSDDALKHRLSSSTPPRESLVAAAAPRIAQTVTGAPPSTPVAAKEGMKDDASAKAEGPRQDQTTNEGGVGEPSCGGDPDSVTTKDKESMTAEGDEPDRTLAGSDASSRLALDNEADWSSANAINEAHDAEEGNARLVPMGNSCGDVGALETHVELKLGEKRTTSNIIIGSQRGDEPKIAEKTDEGASAATGSPRQDETTNDGGIGDPLDSECPDGVAVNDKESITTERDEPDHNLAASDASSGVALENEVDWSSDNVVIDEAHDTEEGNVRLVPTRNSCDDDVDARETHVELMVGEKSTTSNSTIGNHGGDEPKVDGKAGEDAGATTEGPRQDQTTNESGRPVSPGNSCDDVDTRETHVEGAVREKSTTSISTAGNHEGGGQTAAEETDRLSSGAPRSRGGSQHDSDDDRASPRPESSGENSAIQTDYSAHGATEKSHQGEAAVEADMDKLLFDGDGDGDGDGVLNGDVGDHPLGGENSAAPSEYGDDFDDDFEEEQEEEQDDE